MAYCLLCLPPTLSCGALLRYTLLCGLCFSCFLFKWVFVVTVNLVGIMEIYDINGQCHLGSAYFCFLKIGFCSWGYM